MTEPAQRPKRPRVLIIALVLLPLAALFFSMTATVVSGATYRGGSSGLHSIAWVFCLLAIWFNWARVTSVVLLALLTLQWLPGAIRFAGDERANPAASYALIAAALFIMGVVLVFQAPSNQYYRQAKSRRKERKSQRRAKI